VASFKMQYKNVKESASLLPQPLESINDLAGDLVSALTQDFNLGKAQTKDMVPFCRTAVEKYLH
jgi:hypothetical protein